MKPNRSGFGFVTGDTVWHEKSEETTTVPFGRHSIPRLADHACKQTAVEKN